VRRRSWIAFGASLIGVAAGFPTGACAQARAGVSLPGVGVSLPSVEVSVPSVEVSVPSVEVSVPSVEVSLPGVSVSTPSVSASTPSVNGSTPSAPGGGTTGTTEAPASASPPTSSPGGSTPASGGETPSSTTGASGDSGSSSAPGSATARTASAAAAPTSRTSADGAAGRSRTPASRAGRTRGHARHSARGSAAGGAATGSAASGGATRAPVSAGALAAPGSPRSATHHTSNPLDAIGRQIPLPLPVPDWSKPIIIVLLLLAIWLGVRARMAARRARRLEDQRATLLRDVGAMQTALVPVVPARVGGLAMSVAYRPADGPAAGGDFYDVFVPERGKVAIILGDVSGHGHRALTQAALTRYTLRAYLQTGLEPRAALALAGRVLADPTTEHFATVAVAVYDAREGCLTYASAGHPPPIFHGLRTREPPAVCASPPIGWTVPTGRRQTIVSLPAGAVACFFSDGLVEARRDGELLGREHLSEILGTLGPRPDASALLARVRAQAPVTADDMAACILVPQTAVVAADTHVEELEADAQALSGQRTRRFLETCQVSLPDIERTIARARDIAATLGAALLRVELAPTSAYAAALPPSAAAHTVLSDRRPQPTGEPSGAR
jgi:hypothetical protein